MIGLGILSRREASDAKCSILLDLDAFSISRVSSMWREGDGGYNIEVGRGFISDVGGILISSVGT